MDQGDSVELSWQWMKDLLKSEVVRDGRMTPPSDEACYELAISVGGMRSTILWLNGNLRVSSDRNRRLLAALTTIANDAPDTILSGQSVIWAFPQVARTVDRLSILTGLHRHAVEILKAPERAGISVVVSPKPIGWHDYCFMLAKEFRKAMASTNPRLGLKVSNKGPIAKFIAAVAPVISEERPEPDAVARYLTRNADKGNIFEA